MQISAKQRLLRLAAGSVLAAGTMLIPATVASADSDAGRIDVKAPPEMPDIPTDPAEGLPVPVPGHGG